MKNLFFTLSVLASSMVLSSFAHANVDAYVRKATLTAQEAQTIITAMPEAISGQSIQSKVECFAIYNPSIKNWNYKCAYFDKNGKDAIVAEELRQQVTYVLGQHFEPFWSNGNNWSDAWHAEVSCDLTQNTGVLTEY